MKTHSCCLQKHPHLCHLQGPLSIAHLLKLFETALKSCETCVHFQKNKYIFTPTAIDLDYHSDLPYATNEDAKTMIVRKWLRTVVTFGF